MEQHNIHPSKAMPLLTITSPETINKCAKFKLRPSDIFICSYPKSGTTWTQHIIISLLLLHRKLKTHQQTYQSKNNADDDMEIEYNHVSEYAPFFEIDPHWEQQQNADEDEDEGDDEDEDDGEDVNQMIAAIREKHSKLGRRIFNTHLRFDMLPSSIEESSYEMQVDSDKVQASSEAKFIYILRSPLDVCVSFYHHLSHQVEGCYEKTFDNFFNEWMNGDIPFGTWTDHVLSYIPNLFVSQEQNKIKDNKNQNENQNNGIKKGKEVMLITYEEMVKDLNCVLHKIVRYLQLDDYIKSQDIQDIQETFTFRSMSQNITKFQPKSVTWKNHFKFLRKGEIGDSKTIIKSNQRQKFVAKVDDFIDSLDQLIGPENEINKKIQKTVNLF